MSNFTKYLPKEDSFASLGCVIQRDNLKHVENVIKFGSEIGWYTSVVPIHTTSFSMPRAFRTFDTTQDFNADEYEEIRRLICSIKKMRNAGHLLYDSDQYLDDIIRFLTKEPITWRQKNKNICDSPNLYFAILPNGNLAPCCDFRISREVPVQHKSFVSHFKSGALQGQVKKLPVHVMDACMGATLRFLSP